MTTAQTRESRSVRLSQDEWDLAEAISLLQLGGGAGHGLRTALRMAEDQFTEQGRGGELDELLTAVKARREGGDR
jgi:Flp pilus assembly protein TadB